MFPLPNLVQWGSYFENLFPLAGCPEGWIVSLFLFLTVIPSELLQGLGSLRMWALEVGGEISVVLFVFSKSCVMSFWRWPPWVQLHSPPHEPLRSRAVLSNIYGYWALERWLVHIQMWYKDTMHTGLQRLKYKNNNKKE